MPREQNFKDGVIRRQSRGLNDDFTVTNSGHKTMGKVKQALGLSASKRHPRTIIAKEHRLKPTKKAAESPKVGRVIKESEYWPLPPLANKEDFKYWKPWTVE